MLIALALFAVVALLRPSSGENKGGTPLPVVRRGPTSPEYRRMVERRTLPPVTDAAVEPAYAEKRDPLLAALPANARGVVVLEAAAFLSLPVGRMLLRCIGPREEEDLRNAGLDLEHLDRVAFAETANGETMVMVSGDFQGAKKLAPLGPNERAYGDNARLFAPDERDDSDDAGVPSREQHGALWNDQLWVMGQNAPDVRAVIDRVEGRSSAEPALDPNDAYGEIYGRLDARMLRTMLPKEVASKLADDTLRVDFHADANEDVVLDFDVTGTPETTRDLGQSLATLLALQRARAVQQGDTRSAELLDLYAVRLDQRGFSLDAAFPQWVVREALGKCAEAEPESAPEDDDE